MTASSRLRPTLDGWHLDTPRAIGLLVAWTVTALAARLRVPHVDPSLITVPRPMESFATLALVLPVTMTTALLPQRVPWLSVVAGRDLRGFRAAVACTLLVGQLPCVVALSAITRAPLLHVLLVWLLLVAVGIGGLAVRGVTTGGLAPGLVVIGLTQGSGYPPVLMECHLQHAAGTRARRPRRAPAPRSRHLVRVARRCRETHLNGCRGECPRGCPGRTVLRPHLEEDP